MNTTTFFDGMFHTGDPGPVEIVEYDCACEYSLGPYLGYATSGRRVAVLSASLVFGLDPEDCEPLGIEWEPAYVDPNVSWTYHTTLVILPGVGIWVCEPVFDSAREALVLARRRQYVSNSFLGEKDTPVHIALFAMDDDPPNLQGIDPNYYYGPDAYGSVCESLSLRARPSEPDRVDDMIRRLLELIYYSDVKAPDSHYRWEPVPRWLTRYADVPLAS